jgi:hypothetical protein
MTNVIIGTSGTETLTGTAGDDDFRLEGGTDTIVGNGGVDTIDMQDAPVAVTVDLSAGTMSGWGSATMSGISQIYGSWHGGVLTGGSTTTYIAAPGGNTTVNVGPLGTFVVLGNGNDTVNGGAGNDEIFAGAGNNTIDGGAGYNGVSYIASGAYVAVDLYVGAWHDGAFDHLSNIVNIQGGNYGSTLRGDWQNNIIQGGNGNDVIDGRQGNDTLTGGLGADTFIFTAGMGHAVVTDLTPGQGDSLNLTSFGIDSMAQAMADASQSGSDVLLSLGNGSSVTLQNLTLAQLGQAAIKTDTGAYHDFTGTGSGDLMWRDAGGDVAVWTGPTYPNGGFTGQGLGALSTGWRFQAAGDFNGDGVGDVLWRSDSGEVAVWFGTPGSGVQFAGQDLGPLQTSWHFEGVADVTGDGKADVIWQNDNGQVAVWVSQSTSSASFAGVIAGAVDPSWHLLGEGDFNGDGKADFLWQNTNGDVAVWNTQSASSSGVSVTGQDLGPVPGWTFQGIGDFNGDGTADIIWRNSTTGDVALWLSQSGSSASFVGQDLGPLSTSWHLRDIVDLNGDGRSDIVWQNNNGDYALWSSAPGAAVGFIGQDLGYVPGWTIQSQWHGS